MGGAISPVRDGSPLVERRDRNECKPLQRTRCCSAISNQLVNQSHFHPATGERLHSMSTDYSSGFDPVGYLESRWDLSKADTKALHIKYKVAVFMTQFYQDFHPHWDPRGARVLEIGGGPAIGNVIGAGPYVSKITFTDYLPANLEQITLWKEKSPKAFNWDPAFQHVVKETKGEGADVVTIATEWEEQLREKISNLDHSDFTRDGFIDPGLVPDGGFDVLTTSGAFESVAKDKGEFAAMLKTCYSLLRQGGYMAAATYGRNNTYKVGRDAEKEFHLFHFTEEIVREALCEVGFNLERFELIKVDQLAFIPSECYCYVARKP